MKIVCLISVADEEIGGVAGMKHFVESKEFKALNVGFALDEGIASNTEEFNVYYAERAIWRESMSFIRQNVFLVLELNWSVTQNCALPATEPPVTDLYFTRIQPGRRYSISSINF
jgi:hypothetical protein